MYGRDENGNPVIVNPSSILQRIFKPKSDAVRVDGSYVGAKILTPSDTDRIEATSGIIIGTAGTLHVEMADGSEITFPAAALPANQIHPLAIKKVFATGTTATGIIGMY